MNKTTIEWVKNPDGTQGYTWNPITGCLNGCEYCYARKLANGRLKSRYLANYSIAPIPYPNPTLSLPVSVNPFYPRFWKERLYLDWDGIPKGIFTCDMGELFGDWIPQEWQEDIFRIIRLHTQHRFYLLTKQPQNLIKFSPFPSNCWVGATATNQEQYNIALAGLVVTEAKVKYISFEPLLKYIATNPPYDLEGLNWVIIGQQTPVKKATIPKIEWVEEIVRAADKAGIPVFLKDNLIPILPDDEPFYLEGTDGDWRIRQEVPK